MGSECRVYTQPETLETLVLAWPRSKRGYPYTTQQRSSMPPCPRALIAAYSRDILLPSADDNYHCRLRRKLPLFRVTSEPTWRTVANSVSLERFFVCHAHVSCSRRRSDEWQCGAGSGRPDAGGSIGPHSSQMHWWPGLGNPSSRPATDHLPPPKAQGRRAAAPRCAGRRQQGRQRRGHSGEKPVAAHHGRGVCPPPSPLPPFLF